MAAQAAPGGTGQLAWHGLGPSALAPAPGRGSRGLNGAWPMQREVSEKSAATDEAIAPKKVAWRSCRSPGARELAAARYRCGRGGGGARSRSGEMRAPPRVEGPEGFDTPGAGGGQQLTPERPATTEGTTAKAFFRFRFLTKSFLLAPSK